MAQAVATTVAAPPISPRMSFIPCEQKKIVSVKERRKTGASNEMLTNVTRLQADSSRIKGDTLSDKHQRLRVAARTLVVAGKHTVSDAAPAKTG